MGERLKGVHSGLPASYINIITEPVEKCTKKFNLISKNT